MPKKDINDILNIVEVIDLKKKKIPTASKRRLRFLGPIAIIIIFYFAFTLFQYSYKLISLKKEEKELSKQLLLLREEEANMKIEIQKLNDPDYLARYARENYLYSRDGEYIIKIDSKEEENVKDASEDKYYNYVITSFSIGAGLIIIYIIKKSIKK